MKIWGISVDKVKVCEKGVKFVIRHVGPIYGMYEAERKVNAFMSDCEMSDWTWNGEWTSEAGTSYAEFFQNVTTWAESMNGIQTVSKDGKKFRGQNEHKKKPKDFMADNEMSDSSI